VSVPISLTVLRERASRSNHMMIRTADLLALIEAVDALRELNDELLEDWETTLRAKSVLDRFDFGGGS
jgi:hypothetical protein